MHYAQIFEIIEALIALSIFEISDVVNYVLQFFIINNNIQFISLKTFGKSYSALIMISILNNFIVTNHIYLVYELEIYKTDKYLKGEFSSAY